MTEGERYKVGELTFSGNSVAKSEGLRPLFKLNEGDYYNEKLIRKGLEKAQGALRQRRLLGVHRLSRPARSRTTRRTPMATATARPVRPRRRRLRPSAAAPEKTAPIVNVTMRMEEGKQYFVNRITFVGNTTTRDNVIRREVRLFEGGVFNTEALKYSVRRINQLGYFKPLEGGTRSTSRRPPDAENKVDVKLKFEEQNRNQITFGAGVSQYEGFFGQLAFQTSNFLGRGETFSVSAQQGNRAKNYQVGFTEPFLFDRPITGGRRRLQPGDPATSASSRRHSTGGNTVWGFPVGPFSRMFVSYSYQNVKVKDLNPLYSSRRRWCNNPFLRRLAAARARTASAEISKIGAELRLQHRRQPDLPDHRQARYALDRSRRARRQHATSISRKVEGVWYCKQTARTSFGFRGARRIHLALRQHAANSADFREAVPRRRVQHPRLRHPQRRPARSRRPGWCIGGNKSLLFNAEYLITIAGPGAAGAVLRRRPGARPRRELRLEGEPSRSSDRRSRADPFSGDPYACSAAAQSAARSELETSIGMTNAFKTSTGAEIRFFMPVLNVPFRLIFAMNPSARQRAGQQSAAGEAIQVPVRGGATF